MKERMLVSLNKESLLASRRGDGNAVTLAAVFEAAGLGHLTPVRIAETVAEVYLNADEQQALTATGRVVIDNYAELDINI